MEENKIEFKWQPTGTNIIVKVDRDYDNNGSKKTTLLIPETRQTMTGFGTIVAVGPGRYSFYGERQKLDLEVGDVVMFHLLLQPAPQQVLQDNKDYYFVAENSVLAYIKKDEVTKGE